MRYLSTFIFLFFTFWAPLALAVGLEDIPRETARPDFVIFPARQEMSLAPGKETIRQISVINRLGHTALFRLSVEDFTAGTGASPVELLGDELGPYSLKNYLFLDRSEFRLGAGQTTTLNLKIALPSEAPPGGLYGAVTVTAVNESDRSNAQVSSSAASLFFVKITGPVKESGMLQSFTSRPAFNFTGKPISLAFSYANEGNVYVNPYGGIKVRNIFGQTVAVMPIDPWFVLPQSSRIREVSWSPGYHFGWYRATVQLNRGYQNSIDEKTVSLILLPWPILVGILLVILALFLYKRMLQSKR